MSYEEMNEYGTYDAEPQPPRYEPKPKRKSTGFGKTVALALCCSLLGGAVGAVGSTLLRLPEAAVTHSTTILEGQRENTVIDIMKIDTSKLMTPAEVYAANVNSTVGIQTAITTNFWGFQTTSAASGSGFIISEDGYILTNYHVIENANAISVSFYDGSNADAKLIGYDTGNDIAVLKVAKTGLSPVVLGNSGNLNVGDTVIAIGNPLGELTFSLTAGAISALEREITTSAGVTMNLMQTDCAINSGNSGGALFNLYGEVIGITNAKYSSNTSTEASIDNIGFAIPVNHIRNIVESVIEKGYFSKPYIGVSVSDVSSETQSYGLPQGAAVKSVEDDSPAEKADLRVNDIITQVDGTPITGSSQLVSLVKTCTVGQVLKLKVYRQGAYLDLEITVGEQIQSATADKNNSQQSSSSQFPYWGNGSGNR
ncbi:MAG: trypsin-like peptidase domain-containing protein [Oscillospiraceae bacterium]|nr:trypsin-like peptidase domain-containing protein [Oscillospiraceae bacterium]